MISLIQTIAAGNALRIFRETPVGASGARLLRKVTDTFAGEEDPDAFLVSDQVDGAVVDMTSLVNGTLYFYRAYYLVEGIWTDSGTSVSATPTATYQDAATDAFSLVRDRLDLGLQVEVARGALTHADGHIKVLTAPPQHEDTVWPVVTVHLTSESSDVRGIGELTVPDFFDDGDWNEGDGWLADVQMVIMGWSLNPDERIELRKALRRIIVANLPVFDAAGMVMPKFQQQDTEDFSSFNAPVYQVMCTFSCVAPVRVGSNVDAITDVEVTIEE